jgi:hypothetical protein
MAGTNGNGNGSARVGTSTVKQGLAQMLKGGVIVSRDIHGRLIRFRRCHFLNFYVVFDRWM